MVAGWFRSEPTCFDSKLNQNETRIDCGGVCGICKVEIVAEPLVMRDTTVLDGGAGTIDVIATMANSNTHFGAATVTYRLTLSNEGGQVVATQSDTTYILPLEQKYIMAIALEPVGDTAVDVSKLIVKWEIDNVRWHRFEQFEAPNIEIVNKSYQVIATGVNYSKISALVRNRSPYDFNTITIAIVLKDASGKPIAIQQTRQSDMDAGSVREINVPWPQRFAGDVVSVDVRAYVNVFDSQNFRKKYLPGGQYQQTQ